MAWFKPARNRNHPGDPPPKWANLGRAGRIVILLTIVAGIVIALLIGTSQTASALDGAAMGTIATEDLPWSTTSGQRVGPPDQGAWVALTEFAA